MKILVIQLARFGDIYITWPTLRGLRRRFPGAEIDILVRKRFREAVEGCEAVDRVIELDTARIMAPLLDPNVQLREGLLRLSEWVDLVSEADYDLVINLSFSPFSSYLTSLLVKPGARVRGYTRHADGYLAIPDDPSAYFYAQVGIGRFNRYHLGEIFAAVAEVELAAEDWSEPPKWNLESRLNEWREKVPALHQPYLVVHPSSSQGEKTYPAFKWQAVVSGLRRVWSGGIVLVGSASEKAIGAQIFGGDSLINLIGETTLPDLAALIKGAGLVIGGDSAPMHLAVFTRTRCLNLSFASVNFWETGPRSDGSRILFAESPEALPSDRVVTEAQAMLRGQDSGLPVVVREGDEIVRYLWKNHQVDDFEWRLINAIYSGGAFPDIEDPMVLNGLQKLRAANALAREQLARLEVSLRDGVASRLLEQADQAITAIGQVMPAIRPLVAWLETERVRIGPGKLEDVLQKMRVPYDQLEVILDYYLGGYDKSTEASP